MNPDCLQHALTADERQAFDSDGYIVVKDALQTDEVAHLTDVVDRIDQRDRAVGQEDKLLSVTNVLHEDEAFLNLVDCPTTFPRVWSILGWNIYVYHSHMDVTPPANLDTATWSVAWHQDSMRVNDEIETHPRPRLSLKVGFFLSDCSEPGRGNTLVVPGSHTQDEIELPQDGQSNPDGAEPVLLTPGSAIIIDRRVWHSRSMNTSDITRKVIWLGYSYRWLKPKDEMTVGHLLADADPVRRQLLGGGQSANGVYDPSDDDVPLRTWLQEHSPEDGAWTKHARPQARPPAMVRGKGLGRQ